MKNKSEEKFTHLFYLYESWCGSSGGRTGRTFADKFYTGMVSHLDGQRRSGLGPNVHWAGFLGLERPAFSHTFGVPGAPGPAGPLDSAYTETLKDLLCPGPEHPACARPEYSALCWQAAPGGGGG